MDDFIKIIAVVPGSGHSLLVTFSNGETRRVDFSALIAGGGVWAALADPGLFAQVEIDEYQRGVEWPNGADSCADAMYARSEAAVPASN